MKIHRMMNVGVFGLLLVSGVAAPIAASAHAEEATPANFVPPEQRNAAIRYLVAVTFLTPEMIDKLKAVDWEKIGTSIDPAGMTPAFNEAAKLNLAEVLRWTIDGTNMSRCNFESNYEAGVGTLLPQLGQMRQLARALRLDARMNLKNGDADLAAKRVLSMLRLGAHMKQDAWLISVLIGAAIDHPAFAEAVAVAGSPALSEVMRKELLAALRALESPDPIRYQDAIAVERESIISWLTRESASANAWERIKPQIVEDGGPGSKVSLTDEEVRKQIVQLGSAYDAFAVAASSKTDDSEAKKFHDRAQSGEWGTLAIIMMPSLDPMRNSERKYRAELQKAISALEGQKK